MFYNCVVLPLAWMEFLGSVISTQGQKRSKVTKLTET